MKLAIAGDHAGFELKDDLAKVVLAAGWELLRLGPAEKDPSDDYPDFAVLVANAVRERRADRGLIVCGSGVGVSIAANKHPGIRAGLCHDTYSARQGVVHDDMNVLCLGQRVIGPELAADVLRAFLDARYDGSTPRFQARLDKVLAIEKRHFKS